MPDYPIMRTVNVTDQWQPLGSELEAGRFELYAPISNTAPVQIRRKVETGETALPENVVELDPGSTSWPYKTALGFVEIKGTGGGTIRIDGDTSR